MLFGNDVAIYNVFKWFPERKFEMVEALPSEPLAWMPGDIKEMMGATSIPVRRYKRVRTVPDIRGGLYELIRE